MFRFPIVCLAPALIILLSLPCDAAGRTFRVLFVGNAKNTPKTLQLFDGKHSQKIELPRMNLSPVYKLPLGRLSLHLLGETSGKKPKQALAGSPQATLAKGISDFYLIISRNRHNAALPYSMRNNNASPGKVRNGQMLWFNLTKKHITGNVGSQKINLKPKSQKITKAPAKGIKNYHVDIYYQMPKEKDTWPLCETKWLHNPAARIIMFVLPETGSRVPRIMSFTDFRTKKKQP